MVEERYGEVIAALYGESEAVDIDTTIQFQDGKVARIQARLPVRHMERKRWRLPWTTSCSSSS